MNIGSVSARNFVEISVRDTGIGMDESVRSRALEPFFTTRENGQGTGLGLSTVYGFVKESGGFLEIDSSPGNGTTVSMLLPAATARQIKNQQYPSLDPLPEKPTYTPCDACRVLVVEDADDVSEFVGTVLRNAGYKVVEVPDIDSARKTLSSGSKFDLMLTDIVLPGGNGFQLASWALETHPSLQVIFTSGYAEDYVAESAAFGPEVDILTKPYPKEELLRRVGEVLITARARPQ